MGRGLGLEPEVPAVVGDSLSGAVGGRGLQHHDLHLLAGVSLDRGHGALPFARGPHADVRQGQLTVGGRAGEGWLEALPAATPPSPSARGPPWGTQGISFRLISLTEPGIHVHTSLTLIDLPLVFF